MSGRIYLGDAPRIIKSNVKSNSVDLTLISPPYGDIRSYGGDTKHDAKTIEKMGEQIFRVTKDGGVLVWVEQDSTNKRRKSISTFRNALMFADLGFNLFETCVYNRPGRPRNWWTKRFRVDHEYVMIFFKGEDVNYFNKQHMFIPTIHAGKEYSGSQRLTSGKLVPLKKIVVKDTKCPGTVWQYSSSNSEGDKLKMKHPATFPRKFVEDMILCFTKPGWTVADFMCGSGETLLRAQELKRNFVGCDISPEFYALSKKRLGIN